MSADRLPFDPRDTLAAARARKAAKRRERQDRDYLAWIHQFGCEVPGCSTPWPAEYHHEPPKSEATTWHDRRGAMLCPMHHRHPLVGREGLGQEGFEELYGVNLEEISKRRNDQYDEGNPDELRRRPHREP